MDVIDRITKEQELAVYQGPDRVERLRTVLEHYKKTTPEQECFSTGIPTLDRDTGGAYTTQMWAISGPTGHGKTTFCQTLTRSLAAQGACPLWFTYEVGVGDFAQAFHADYHSDLVLPLTLSDNSISWLAERILEARLKYGTKAVFIDHVHYLIDLMPRGSNMSLVIGELTRKLKRVAVDLGIVVCLIAHQMKARADEEPGLGSIRDSSFIEQESDVVVYCYRWPEDRTVTVAKIAKNRKRGKVDGKIPLIMTPNGYVEKAVQND